MESTYSCLLGDRVGVVEAHVADAAVILRHAEVEADGLCVTDMQISVRFRRETGADARRVLRRARLHRSGPRLARPGARGVLPRLQILLDDVADEVGDVGGLAETRAWLAASRLGRVGAQGFKQWEHRSAPEARLPRDNRHLSRTAPKDGGMRIHVLSDIHLGVRALRAAGGRGGPSHSGGRHRRQDPGVDWARASFDCPVSTFAGNHEYYGGHFRNTLRR